MALVKVTTKLNADTPAVSQVLNDEDHSEAGVIATLKRLYRSDELAEFSVEPIEDKPKPARARSGA